MRKRTPITGLPERLLEQRNLIRAVLGQQWWQATLLSAGRLLFDYLCLLFSVRAVGAHPRPSLILLAYAVAGIIGLVPITPGGLGIVEASLSGVLVLAGLTGVQAVLATLAYRLAVVLAAAPVGPFRLRRLQVTGTAIPTPRPLWPRARLPAERSGWPLGAGGRGTGRRRGAGHPGPAGRGADVEVPRGPVGRSEPGGGPPGPAVVPCTVRPIPVGTLQ